MIKKALMFGAGVTLSLSAIALSVASINGNVEMVKASSSGDVLYVYIPNSKTKDHYSPYGEVQWDSVNAYLYGGDGEQWGWPGQPMTAIGNDVYAVSLTGNRTNAIITGNSGSVRNTWNGATVLDISDLSTNNLYKLMEHNSEDALHASTGAWQGLYTWSLTGVDAASNPVDIVLPYNGGVQFQKEITLETGTVFEFKDTLGNTVDSMEEGVGSALTGGYVTYNESTKKFTVVNGGDYEIYVKPADGTVWMQLDSASEAEAWAEDFVKNVGCLETHDAAPAKWGTYAASWAANLTNGAKFIFTEATASNTGTYVEKAAFIHDMCVKKYDSCTTFMTYNDGTEHSRAGAVSVMNVNNYTVNSDGMLFAAIAAGVSMVTVGGFFLLRRKHQN